VEGTSAVEAVLRDALALGDENARQALVAAHLESSEAHDIELLLAGLKDASERNLSIDAHKAARLANLLVFAAEVAEQPRHRALGLLARADALRIQGQFGTARELYEQAGQVSLSLGDGVTWARTRTGWVLTMHYLGQGQEALPVAEQALQTLLEHEEWLRAGGLSLNSGLVCYELGQYARSNELYGRALELYKRAAIGHPELQTRVEERAAKARANMAVNHALLGDFARAIQLYNDARAAFERLGEQESALRVEHYIATLHAGQGQLTRALRVHADALATAERAGLADTVVEVALEMIACYTGLNRHTDALELAEQLVKRCESNNSPTEAAKARLACAQSLAALGQVDRALHELDLAATAFAASGQSSDLAATDLLRARLHLTDKAWSASLSAGQHALASFVERGLTVPRAQAELLLAHAHLGLEEPTDAARHARTALGLAAERDMLPLTQQAHHVLARAADAGGESDKALAEYEAAVRDLEQVQSRLATQLRLEFLGDKLQVFHDAIDAFLRAGDARRAFGMLERAKSRALVDYLTSSADVHVRARDRAEQALLDELTSLRDEHHWFYGRLHNLDPDPAAPSEVERDILRTAVAEREKKIAHTLERLALLRDAEGLEAIGWTPAQVPPEPPRVPHGSVLLEYLLREDDGVVFVVTPSGTHVVPLPGGARGVKRLLGRWQLNLDSVAHAIRLGEPLEPLIPNAHGTLHALYRALVEPVATHLRDAQRLVVVPYGPAHAVPFQGLFDGQQHLIERLQVVTCPSSALLALSERRPRGTERGALVVGHSNGGQLAGVIDEATSVASLVGGTCYLEHEATRDRVLSEAPRKDIVHLAAHGEARLDNPLFAHIALADGQLSMVDVFNLRLDGALVTLSACETGRSAVVGGDELVGLSRGFLFAGAATLVHSLWRVDDGSTARLMQCFYGELMTGASPGAALRKAQCSLLSEGRHPHLWAAFQLVGRDG
jgi:tetratricopeptide (TPR) repeat protein